MSHLTPKQTPTSSQMNQLNSVDQVPTVYNEKLDTIPICGHLHLDVAVDESYFKLDLHLVVVSRGLLGERHRNKDWGLGFPIPCDVPDAFKLRQKC